MSSAFCAVLKKYSPVRTEIGMEFLRVVERGLTYKWQNELLSFKFYLDWNSLEVINERKPLRFLQIFVPLVFWAVGCIVGLLTFLVERPKTRRCFSKENVFVMY